MLHTSSWRVGRRTPPAPTRTSLTVTLVGVLVGVLVGAQVLARERDALLLYANSLEAKLSRVRLVPTPSASQLCLTDVRPCVPCVAGGLPPRNHDR